jgi:hypothetical protein
MTDISRTKGGSRHPAPGWQANLQLGIGGDKANGMTFQGAHGIKRHHAEGGGIAYANQRQSLSLRLRQTALHGSRPDHGAQAIIAIQYDNVRLLTHYRDAGAGVDPTFLQAAYGVMEAHDRERIESCRLTQSAFEARGCRQTRVLKGQAGAGKNLHGKVIQRGCLDDSRH